MEKKKQNVVRVTVGVLLVIVGVYFLSVDYIKEKREVVFNDMNLEIMMSQEANLDGDVSGANQDEIVDEGIEETQNNETSSEESEVVNQEASSETGNQGLETGGREEVIETITEPSKTTSSQTYETYIGMLEIPKISFTRGFYSKESSLNNLKVAIKILESSDYPDVEKGNVILAGHSGNYSNSYFANLYQLNEGDVVYVTYQGKRYTYEIVNIYLVEKVGTVSIYRNKNKSTLTLITCTKDDDDHQTVYIAELVS